MFSKTFSCSSLFTYSQHVRCRMCFLTKLTINIQISILKQDCYLTPPNARLKYINNADTLSKESSILHLDYRKGMAPFQTGMATKFEMLHARRFGCVSWGNSAFSTGMLKFLWIRKSLKCHVGSVFHIGEQAVRHWRTP